MMFRTHLAIGFLAAVAFLTLFPQKHPLLFVLVAMAFGSLPDIDTQNSWIGHKFPFLSYFFNLLFGHRGITHSIFVPIAAYFLCAYFGLNWLGIAFVVGYCAHIFADAITKEGINLLHPIAQLRIQGFMSTGGVIEYIVLIGVILLDIIIIINFVV